jgi:fumarate reductase subunit C
MSRQPYIRPLSKTTWYMRKGRYRIYMLREMTCLLVGFYSFLVIFGLAALADNSAQRWDGFLAAQQTLPMILVHGFALIYFLIYQTFAWFELAPKAMPLQVGEKKLPDSYIVIAHYIAWAVLSALIFWLSGVF